VLVARALFVPAVNPRPVPDRFWHERALIERGLRVVAGVDEAGRGPLAGPVVVGAFVFGSRWIREGLPRELAGLNDSKQLTPKQREQFAAHLEALPAAAFALANAEPAEIDALNILRATHAAMARAVADLPLPPDHLLVDGLPVAGLRQPQTALVKGDALSYSIAAASVLAKVARDRLMTEYDRCYPQYGFGRHKGYPTPEHLAALARHGPCPIHRRSFAPVRSEPRELF
jgi:ribonuclease HII